MRLSRFPLIALGLAPLSGCAEEAPARAQWRVTVSTDAPLPLLADRLLVEVLRADGSLACAGCRRQFDAFGLDSLPLSFGVAQSPEIARVRARLFRSAVVSDDGLPATRSLIDATGTLPPAGGVTPVTLELWADCFGVEAVPSAGTTCDPATRELVPEPILGAAPRGAGLAAPGSWAPAQRVPCPSAPPAEMVCIEGGVFLLGSAFPLLLDELEEAPERVVQLSPFLLDRNELTVAEIEASIADGSVTSTPHNHALDDRCTFGGPDPAVPVNCTTRDLAEEACLARGKRLPTEAEWEYAASNAGAETAYPWGADPDVCAHAWVGRGQLAFSDSVSCLTGNPPIGPTAAGGAADETLSGARNLAGNVSEWTADALARYDDACWRPGELPLVNPRCDEPGALAAIRGGHWASGKFETLATNRSGGSPSVITPHTGIRCARSF